MDHAVLSTAPAHHLVVRETAQPFARGEAPAWTLTETAGGIALAIGNGPTLQFGRGVWRVLPSGRTLVAIGPNGTLHLRVDHGRCRDGGGRHAVLTIGRREMPGCMLDTGGRPYDAND